MCVKLEVDLGLQTTSQSVEFSPFLCVNINLPHFEETLRNNIICKVI